MTFGGLIGTNWPTGGGGSGPPEVQDAVTFARERLGFEPDAIQVEVLKSEAKSGILNCTRQWGKSTTAVVKAVHRAYTRPESLILVASPALRQSGEFIRKSTVMLERLRIERKGPTTTLLCD